MSISLINHDPDGDDGLPLMSAPSPAGDAGFGFSRLRTSSCELAEWLAGWRAFAPKLASHRLVGGMRAEGRERTFACIS